jgi:FAD/FMN-containing dehydrogenase
MKGIRVDPATRTAVAQPGLWWRDYDRETQAFGLASPGGEISDTGIAGLTLGGGIGWLSRMHGLACDNLTAADVVTADGALVRASTTENSDLFWGLRGGGGNFGIVTSFEYRLHELGPMLAGMLVYTLDQAADALAFAQELASAAPREVSLEPVLLTAPPLPFLPESLHGKPVLALVVAYVGEVAAGERALERLRAYGRPAVDLIQPMPYTALQSMFDEGAPRGALWYVKSEWLRPLDAAAIETLVAATAEMPSAEAQIPLRLMGDPGRPG